MNRSLSLARLSTMLFLIFLYSLSGKSTAESIRPPCMRFLYVESYEIEKEALPQGLEIVRVKTTAANSSDDDYLDYRSSTPILLEEGDDAFLKIENGKVFRSGKNRFKGLEGRPGDPIHERWTETSKPSLALRLSRLARLEKEINPSFRFGSDKRVEHLPKYPFAIKGIASPKWKDAKIAGVPFRIPGKVFYREVEQKCPSAENH